MKKRLPSLTFGLGLALFAIDIALSFVYAAIPTTQIAARQSVDVAQFLAMALTGLIALRWMITSL